MKPIKVGILGAGSFARAFVPLFKAHPLVRGVSIAERIPERLREEAARAGVTEAYGSLEELLESDCDAVGIFTQRWMHAPQAIAALKAGKHVYSCVPAGFTLDELGELVETVRRTGLTYMLGETSYYYPSAIFCREMWRRGRFGRFVYGEGEYIHDMSHGFYQAYEYSGGPDWKRTAGVPPMLYPTHTMSMIVSVTGARMTRVSCLGQVDQSGDGIFGKGLNLWDNAFSNETALFRTSDGGSARINELRRVGHWGGRSVRLSIFGTEGCFEEQPDGEVWVNHAREVTPLGDLLRCSPGVPDGAGAVAELADGTQYDFHSGMAPVHPKWRLPAELVNLPTGHYGSHLFLVDDFVRACTSGALPPNHAWAAARYNIPGIIAHESAKRDGELIAVPDLGDPPSSMARLDDQLSKLAPAVPAWTLPKPAYVGASWW
jgi:predicted dehydrogenase